LDTKLSRKAKGKRQNLKNKRILITAGPTWVPIDNVRVISNIATGVTGVLLAEKLQRLGAKVTLLMGPAGTRCLNKKIRLIRFKFFDELKNLIKRELKSNKYDIVIHSAAVSDFKPAQSIKGKINSGRPYNLKLLPLPKVIRDIRILNPKAKLVMFKLEYGISDKALIERARKALVTYRADLVIANAIYPRYKAFILDEKNVYSQVNSKKELVKKLINLLLKK